MVDGKRLFRKVKKKPDYTQVFTKEETKIMSELAWEDFHNHVKVYDLAPIALLFQMQTGLMKKTPPPVLSLSSKTVLSVRDQGLEPCAEAEKPRKVRDFCTSSMQVYSKVYSKYSLTAKRLWLIQSLICDKLKVPKTEAPKINAM
ncbi:MAG: hypothetical protein LUF35_07180 [Lachnospiraceae bacterium]|nr:hypothetical protein [Lachnospiraceae bacterium]